MALSVDDHRQLQRAIALAQQAIGLTEPNPRVGCVLHDAQGRLIGEGHTQQAGGPHAEAMALRQASAAGHATQGGTAWVSLEPCAHHGRTPPCADALVAAGLKRVVVASTDPFPAVAGQGVARLRAAGISVELAEPGDTTAAALALNMGFFSRVLRQRPWVRMKLAASLDGRTALPDGRSQWITGAAARADGQHWRHRAGALLTGIGTVLHDDPRLDVRLPGNTHQPLRVVLDSQARLPTSARILAEPGRCLVVTAWASPAAQQALRDQGAEVQALPAAQGGGIDLPALMHLLATHGVNELHVEAGATLSGALWQAGLVDECLLYLAPKWLGPGRELLQLPSLAALADAPTLQTLDLSPIGPDLRWRLQRPDADAFVQHMLGPNA